MAKFSNVELNTPLWSCIDGWGTVIESKWNDMITVKFENITRSFTLDGKLRKEDKYPVLYFSEVELHGKDIFNLKSFLKNNIQLKKFKKEDDNWYFEYNDYGWDVNFEWDREIIGTFYFNKKDITSCEIEDILNKNKVTVDELQSVLKELSLF